MKYAFFDLDNTVYNGYSSGEMIAHFRTISDKGELLYNKNREVIETFKKGEIDYHTLSQLILDFNSELLEGFVFDEVEREVDKMLEAKDKLVFDYVEPTLDFLRSKGYEIIIVSAGPDIIVRRVAEKFEIERFLATVIPTKDGIYTGESTHLQNAHEKTKFIHGLIGRDHDHDTIAFGDSVGDVPMLESVDKAFVFDTNHYPEIIEIAKERGWTIFSSFEEIKKQLRQSRAAVVG